MKKIFLIVFVFVSNISVAQFYYPTKEEANDVKSKKIAIELLNENNPNNIILNNALKNVFNEYWNNSKGIEYFSSSKIDEIIKAKNTDYVYLLQSEGATESVRTRVKYLDNSGNKISNSVNNSIEVKKKYVAFRFNYYPFSLKRFKNDELSLITRVCFANSFLSKSDYLFLNQQLDRLLNFAYKGKSSNEYYGNIAENSEKIKNSQLLIMKDYFKEKDLSKMNSHYKNKFQIVEYNEQEKIVLDKTNDNIYLKILWSDLLKVYVWVTIDCETSRVLSQMSFGGIKFGVDHNANELIKAKHLKYSTNKLFQKVNSRNYR